VSTIIPVSLQTISTLNHMPLNVGHGQKGVASGVVDMSFCGRSWQNKKNWVII